MKGMRFSLNPTTDILQRRGIEAGGAVQKFIDSEVVRLSAPYIPATNDQPRFLANHSADKNIPGSGEVIYDAPYARYQYYGKVMVGPPPKTITDRDLQYHGGPLRGSFWFERMKADHRDEILNGAARLAGGDAKK